MFFARQYLRVAFRIGLHIDDLTILHKIQQYLGVGFVRSTGMYCIFSISNTSDITRVFIPLLDTFLLLTAKLVDYLDFKEMTLFLTSIYSMRVEGYNLNHARLVIQGMNSGRL